MKMLFVLLVVGAVVPCANQSASSEDLHPGIIGEDARVPLDAQGAPWDAVGQVNVGGFRIGLQCTGTLVAPTVVVTAAHCVINRVSDQPFPLKDVHFLAGVRGGENKGYASARCLHFLPNYRYVAPKKYTPDLLTQNVPMEFFTNDVVVIVLDNKLQVIRRLSTKASSRNPVCGSRTLPILEITGSCPGFTSTAACCGLI